MLRADRGYWGIETGLHLRLDVTAGEDRSRVRHRTSALNLAMIRRAVVSVAVSWIENCPNPRKATLSGFFDHMAATQSQKAFSLVTARYSSALSTCESAINGREPSPLSEARNSVKMKPAMSDLTELLDAIDGGDPKAADHSLPLVYEELRRLPACATLHRRVEANGRRPWDRHHQWHRAVG